MTDPTPTPEQMEALENALAQGKKLEAIKVCRETTGKGLKESKEFVEALIPRLLEQDPERYARLRSSQNPGCLSVLLAFFSMFCALTVAIIVRAVA